MTSIIGATRCHRLTFPRFKDANAALTSLGLTKFRRLVEKRAAFLPTLSLVYAQAHPTRVTEMILFGSRLGQRKEFDWLFRGGLQILFPQEWQKLRDGLTTSEPDSDVVEAYHRLLNAPDEAVCKRKRLKSGAGGSLAPQSGHRLDSWREGSLTLSTRWRSLASSRTTFVPMRGSRTGSSCAMPTYSMASLGR